MDTSLPRPYTLFSKYEFCTSSRIGPTSLVPGRELVSGREVIARVVPADAQDDFMRTEGLARMVLNSNPHPAIPRLLASLEPGAQNVAAAVSHSAHAQAHPDAQPDAAGFLVMEKTFGDLHTHVRTNGPMDEALARSLFRQIALGVAHCHALGIVLRDMKLGKIMFSNPEATRVVLADLDGAQVLPPGLPQTLSDQRGSPAYVAPEVLSCKPYNGPKADVWSLGVILYIMLTGTYPFQDPSPACLFQKIALGVYTVPRHLSQAAQRLLKRMLCRDPAARYSVAQVLADKWVSAEGSSLIAASRSASRSPQLSAAVRIPSSSSQDEAGSFPASSASASILALSSQREDRQGLQAGDRSSTAEHLQLGSHEALSCDEDQVVPEGVSSAPPANEAGRNPAGEVSVSPASVFFQSAPMREPPASPQSILRKVHQDVVETPDKGKLRGKRLHPESLSTPLRSVLSSN